MRNASLCGATEFSFLGESGQLPEIGWDGGQREKLWRYNQHYFDDLNAVGAKERSEWHRCLLIDWVSNNPPANGTGWEPYPTSLRIVNWIKWSFAGNELPVECVQSLAVQVRWLRRRFEYHLLGNHLFANAKAMVFAGLFFEGSEADQWLALGLKILVRELPEQVLPDGGHFERSTMYHALALEEMLDLINVTECFRSSLAEGQRLQTESWRVIAPRMHGWLHAMSHPDGEFGFFNDAAFGIAPSRAELDAYAARLHISMPSSLAPFQWFSASGYARLETPMAVALLDMAPIGPDYLPGHAHADTLSFELSVAGQRVLVNSGTSCYGLGAERLRQRGTAAHNTVVVDGLDSSEVWGGFRVARRALPMSPKVAAEGDAIVASCGHDGYTRLRSGLFHRRRWHLLPQAIQVDDEVVGGHSIAEAMYHFHPDVLIIPRDGAKAGDAQLPNGKRLRWSAQGGEARIEPGTWHPRFGESKPNRCLVLRLEAGRASLRLSWVD